MRESTKNQIFSIIFGAKIQNYRNWGLPVLFDKRKKNIFGAKIQITLFNSDAYLIAQKKLWRKSAKIQIFSDVFGGKIQN